MPPFKKPKFKYDWILSDEIKAIQKLGNDTKNGIPKPKNNQLLVATWNIANLDTQKRIDGCYDLIAEIIKPFDLVAIQEVNANLKGIDKVVNILRASDPNYSYVFTDVAGNEERLCYVFRSDRVAMAELAGELAPPPTRKFSIKFSSKTGKKQKRVFKGFDRHPYVVGWRFNSQEFTTYNCHIYFGKEKERDIEKFRRRILEVYTLTEWVRSRNKKPEKLFSKNIILLGDMNIPSIDKKDPVYRRLKRRNMRPLEYHDHIESGSNLKGDKPYDQLVVVKPFSNKLKFQKHAIFAWDNGVFSTLWKQTEEIPKKRTEAQFRRYVKWAISDHRVLWTLINAS